MSRRTPFAVGKWNPMVRCHAVDLANHFSILAPATKLLAGRIKADTGGPRISR